MFVWQGHLYAPFVVSSSCLCKININFVVFEIIPNVENKNRRRRRSRRRKQKTKKKDEEERQRRRKRRRRR